MELLQTLLFVYAAILFISAIFSALSFYYYKNKLYLFALYLWLGTFFNALAEGAFQRTYLEMILGLATYFVCSIVLVQILAFVTSQKFPLKRYAFVMGAGLLCAIFLNWQGARFVWISLPVAFGVAFPMLHCSIRTLWNSQTNTLQQGTRFYCGLVIANAIHFLDYPFLRLHPSFSVFGFTVALTLLMALSIFLPSFIIKSISDRYSNKVSGLNRQLLEYQSQMADLMSLAQVGELSFSFVHDMASPTTLLLHYSKEISALQSRGIPTGDQQILSYSRGIEQATSRLLKLQRLFRAMIKKEGGSDPCPVDLRESIQGCLELFQPFLDQHDVQVEVTLPQSSGAIVLLPGVIERVLLNLFQNAVNALMSCEVRKIALALEASAGSQTITIRDSGPGIPSERLERLWERFGHSETARSIHSGNSAPRTGGSGFGLYKVKQLIESVHGQISVETSKNGTIFKIDLPQKDHATQSIPSTNH
jgi:signal transduction histidine kinase